MAGWASFEPQQSATNGHPGWGSYAGNAGVQTPPPVPPAKAKAGEGKRLRLETTAQIRREIVKVYRQIKVGELDVTKGTKLIYALEVLSRILERENVDKLADRLDAVEGSGGK